MVLQVLAYETAIGIIDQNAGPAAGNTQFAQHHQGICRVTATPLETEMELRKILPKRYWKSWNRQLVSFGQTLCTPRHPQCNRCPIAAVCDRVGVTTKHSS